MDNLGNKIEALMSNFKPNGDYDALCESIQALVRDNLDAQDDLIRLCSKVADYGKPHESVDLVARLSEMKDIEDEISIISKEFTHV